MSDEQELLSVVESLQGAAGRHAVNEIMAMFTDDAEFELVGLTRLVGKKEIRSIFEYDEGVDGVIRFVNRTVQGDTINCQLVEHNDRLRLAGIDEMVYPSCVLTFKNKRIRSWRATPDPVNGRAFNEFWGPVRQWIADHHPADYARMFTSEGGFIRSRDNGKRAVELGKEYRKSGAG